MSQPTCSSPDPISKSVISIVKEIRSSLFLATSVIGDNVLLGSISSCGNCRKSSTFQFECGRLKYSHVKGKWSILHRPIPFCNDPDDIEEPKLSNSKKNGVAMVVASLWPASKEHAGKPIRKKSSQKRKRRLYDEEKNTLCAMDENNVGCVSDLEDDHSMTEASTQPLPSRSRSGEVQRNEQMMPPIELVRCLLYLAEFVSYLNCARREVETSIQTSTHDENDVLNVNANRNGSEKRKNIGNLNDAEMNFTRTAKFRPRQFTKKMKHGSINLQPLLIASMVHDSTFSSPKSSSLSAIIRLKEDGTNVARPPRGAIVLQLIDECIRFAHTHTLDLIDSWSSSWETRTYLQSEIMEEIVDNENQLLSMAGTKTVASKSRVERRLHKTGKISSEAKAVITGFVRSCLAHPLEETSESNSRTLGSTVPSQSNHNEKNKEFGNIESTLSSKSKRKSMLRRSFISAHEPSDSLATTSITERRNKCDHRLRANLLLSKKTTGLTTDKEGHSRRRSSCNISRPSPSVLETTKTRISRRMIRKALTNSNSERKIAAQLGKGIKTHRSNEGSTTHIGKPSVVNNSDYGGHNPDFTVKCKTGVSDEKTSAGSLNVFSENEDEENGNDILNTLKEKKCSNNSGCVASPSKQESKNRNVERTLSRTFRWDGVVTSPLVGNQKKIENKNISFESSVLDPKLNGRNGDDTSLGEYCMVKDQCRHEDNAAKKQSSIGIKERSLKLSPPPRELCDEILKLKFQSSVEKQDIHTESSANNHHSNHCEVDGGRVKNKDENNRTKYIGAETLNALAETPSLPWVRLTHVGHISDYHGYKRRYEHIAPLHFGTIDDIRKQIGRTLVENSGDNEENDEDIIKENADYERAIKEHELLAEKERSVRAKVKNESNQEARQKSKEEVQNSMSVMFSLPTNAPNAMISLSTKDSAHDRINNIFDFDESELQPPAKFKFFDEEDSILFNVDENSKDDSRTRRSRSAQMVAQKKTSIQILNQMLHSLDFIEKYNRKPKEVTKLRNEKREEVVAIESKTETEKTTVAFTMENVESSENSNEEHEGDFSAKKCERTAKCDRRESSDENTDPVEFKPLFVPLTPTAHLENYKALQKQYSCFRPLKAKGDIEGVIDEIRSILNEDDLLYEYLKQKEFVLEEKELSRCIRGYSNKADQEKIEKKNFEEEQKLRQHEFEYYHQHKFKKNTPENIEWKKMFTRRIRYVGSNAPLPTSFERCRLKPRCLICDPILRDKSPDESVIYFPGFRQVKEDIYIPCAIDSSKESTVRRNTSYKRRVKLASSLKLLELFHTFEFIRDYNNGMIVSRKKRRKKVVF